MTRVARHSLSQRVLNLGDGMNDNVNSDAMNVCSPTLDVEHDKVTRLKDARTVFAHVVYACVHQRGDLV